MRFAVLGFTMAVLSISAGAATHPRPLVGPSELSISFVAPGVVANVMDVGRVAHQFRGNARHTVIRQEIGIRIDGRASGRVLLRASVRANARYAVRVDGMQLGAAPVTLGFVPVGTVTAHRIEIVVPTDAPEGAIDSDIDWEVGNG